MLQASGVNWFALPQRLPHSTLAEVVEAGHGARDQRWRVTRRVIGEEAEIHFEVANTALSAWCARQCMQVSSLIATQSLIVLLITGTQAKPMLYEGGDWNSLWWYPKQAAAPVLGTQVKVEDAAPRIPHLIFVPAGVPPEGGWPVIVFLHGQGESSPSPLEGLALQGPPQHAGRHATTLPFAVISPQKPMGSQFFDDDVASAIAATIRHYLATQPLDARRGHAT